MTNVSIWIHFGEVRGDARRWLRARWKANRLPSIRVNWTFLVSITVPELWGEMCTARLFSQGSTSLHSNFTWTWSSPSTIHSVRKLETLSYPMVKTVSLCVPSFWHNTGVWRTDRQTDGFDVAHTARCKNIPKQIFVGAFFAPLRRHFGMFVHRRQCYSQHHCIHLQQPATIINTWRIIWKNNIIIKTVTSTTL